MNNFQVNKYTYIIIFRTIYYYSLVQVYHNLFYLFLYLNLFILFIYFWLLWVFIAAHRLSLVVVCRGYSSLWCTGFSLQWLLLLQSTGSRAQAQQLWRTGLVTLQHVGSSRTRARTRVPCIDRWILNHCTTREAPIIYLMNLYC